MSVKAIPLARVEVLAPFLRFLNEIGAPSERLLEAARLSPEIVARPETLFPLRQGLRFIDRAARSEGIPHLGLVVGQSAHFADLGEMLRLLSPTMTLHAALVRVMQFISLVSSAERLSLLHQGAKAFFCHSLVGGELTGARHGSLYSLLLMIDLIRLAAGPHWRPYAVWLPASEATWRSSHEAMLGTAVLLGGDRWAVAFDRVLLAEPLHYLTVTHQQVADPLQQLQAAAPAIQFADSLRQVIVSLLPYGNPPISIAAEVAGLSIRTLQRRLREEGCSYSRLVEEARLRTARRLMRERNVKLIEVALELGYSDAANFTRAFRRWTGLTPQEARRGGTDHGIVEAQAINNGWPVGSG